LALRAGPVRLACPPRRRAAKIPGLARHVDIWAIEAREIDPT